MTKLHNNRIHSRKRYLAKRLVCGLLIIATLSVVVGGIAVWSYRMPYTPPDTTGWQTGDIFFSSGNSWRSLIVRWKGESSDHGSTHCGFVIMVKGKPMLIHMSTDKNKIVMESVEEYARENDVSSITAMRPKIIPDTTKLRRRLVTLLGEPRAFDNAFDHNDTTEYYCTELVVREMSRCGNASFALMLANKKYIYPSDIEKSGLVDELNL